MILGIKQHLRDTGRAHVDVRKLLYAGRFQFFPRRAGVLRAVERRRTCAGVNCVRILWVLYERPDVLHGRRQVCPPCGALIPTKQAHIRTRIKNVRIAGVGAKVPDARLKIHAGVAVGVHPGLAMVVAKPGGVACGACIDFDVRRHVASPVERISSWGKL